jgi:hypothetical protein
VSKVQAIDSRSMSRSEMGGEGERDVEREEGGELLPLHSRGKVIRLVRSFEG